MHHGLRTLALAAALLLAAGCGDDSPSTATTGTDEPGMTTTTVPATTATPTETETQRETTTTTPRTTTRASGRTIRIRVVQAAPQGGIARPRVNRGERVTLVVRSDVADEVHLHGYDISRDVAAGGTARITFVARIPGRFEVELEERHVRLAEITVE